MRKMLYSIRKTLTVMTIIVSVFILVWGFASYIDVIMHNVAPNPLYHEWNLFTMLLSL